MLDNRLLTMGNSMDPLRILAKYQKHHQNVNNYLHSDDVSNILNGSTPFPFTTEIREPLEQR